MGRYNLLDEDWIPVLIDESGESKKVSLIDLFENSHKYISLACDTKTQEFAVFRFLLAITQTVFSRFNYLGQAYDFIELDDRYKQIENVDEDNAEEYEEVLIETWQKLYEKGSFPDIVIDYLEKWRDRFYLFDDEYPFYQVCEDEISIEYTNKNPGRISGKNINRRISESNNKLALFSPKNEIDNNKEMLKYDEIVRWLLTFQGYTGLSDKTIFGEEKYKASKGWLFDIGGVYLSDNNLFVTLLINTILFDDRNYFLNKQKPCWEYTSKEIINKKLNNTRPDNLAELYTDWSRAVNIDSEINEENPFFMSVVKLPEIEHVELFLEPMTIWKKNNTGESKDRYTPRKHPINQSIWRSFGNIVLPDEKRDITPGVIKWYKNMISRYINHSITINTVSMQDDGNATSWVPVNEIIDTLNVNQILIIDDVDGGWVERITNTIDLTKKVVSLTFRRFLADISLIRNYESASFVDKNVEELYFLIDAPFREWISSIDFDDSKDEKVIYWKKELKLIVEKKTEEIISQATSRDYRGVIINEKAFNIINAYSKFKFYLDKDLAI